ncbi:hypothetical protein RhiXN_09837 [Rhizoctonia solani]|uniref:Uncharacterized protein n=1 Tax=Rhizoctonia solani TaxID=456999 RepID=A0A8H8NZF0_9AGAM|nr:uncharacterized protein RhiXN_09837 [Rhizoctonia solani]QRW22250.1 hypothetical protein RhiXN_09837 [Rhizoctonia solani]
MTTTEGISGSDVHTVVVSDPNGATLTFVDTVDTTSETRNRRVRVVAALGIDAWRESVTTNLARDTLAPGTGSSDNSGIAVGRVECDLGRVLTLPVHGSVAEALNPVLLVTLNGSQDAPWSALQEKVKKSASHPLYGHRLHMDSFDHLSFSGVCSRRAPYYFHFIDRRWSEERINAAANKVVTDPR